MVTAESVKAKLQGLIATANAATGNADADLTAAVNALVAGFGQGGGGGLFGMLNDIWTYGTFSTPEYLAERLQPFYCSIPAYTTGVIFFKEKKNAPCSRPTYVGILVFGSYTFKGEKLSIPPNGENYENAYTGAATDYGTSHEQKVTYFRIPAQGVNSPSNGYEMTFLLFKVKNSSKEEAPQYYDDKIRLTTLEANAWTTIPGTEQKVYFGFAAPVLDTEEG